MIIRGIAKNKQDHIKVILCIVTTVQNYLLPEWAINTGLKEKDEVFVPRCQPRRYEVGRQDTHVENKKAR